MAVTRAALNPGEAIAEQKTLTPSFKFLVFMRGIREDLDLAPSGFNPVSETLGSATIAATSMPTDGDLSAGLYRLQWYCEVVTAAGVSSDFQITIAWTSSAVTKQKVGAVVNGNTTATYESDTVMMHVDAATPITYALTYNSNPAAGMVFSLYLTLERMAGL